MIFSGNKPFNTELDTVPGIVTDINDPQGMGRIQIQRIDQTNIPIANLPWTFLHSPRHTQIFTNNGSVGESPHGGILIGSWINVPKDSSDQQTTVSKGTIPSNGQGS